MKIHSKQFFLPASGKKFVLLIDLSDMNVILV